MGQIEVFERVKDELTVVQVVGDAGVEHGLGEGELGEHELGFGVELDLRQQLTGNIRAVFKVGISRPKFAWGSEMPLQFAMLGSQHHCFKTLSHEVSSL